MTPTLVLTRPEAQSRALVAELDAVPGLTARVVVAPIMEIVCAGDWPNMAPYAAVILTSANAVRCGPPLVGCKAHCVGVSTADAARAGGAEVLTVARTADELVGRTPGPGPLLHLRGEHARGAVAERLTRAGTETHEAIVYRQEARSLSDEAREAIAGEDPVILPLFSPRSAKLVGASVHPGPAVHAIAMSPAVAETWTSVTGGAAEICGTPTRDAMRDRIFAALRRKSP